MTLNVEEGFHKGTLISCVLISLFGSMFTMMLAPNTPYLIRMYLPDVKQSNLIKYQLSDEDLGTYTGIFTAAFFVGMIPGSIMWGRIADLFGRRPAMVATLICMYLFI